MLVYTIKGFAELLKSINKAVYSLLIIGIILKVSSFCYFLFFCLGSCVLTAWSSAHRAGSRIYEQLSRDLQPVLSGDLPPWIHLLAEQLLWEVWALLKVHIKLKLQATKSEAVVERRHSLGPGGAVDLLLWVQREVPNSCDSQGRFRGQWGMEGLGSHGNSIWPQKPSRCVCLDSTFLREIYTP